MTFIPRTALALLFTLPLAVSAVGADEGHGHDHDHVASAGEISVVHPWARAASAGQSTLVFFEIENAGIADRLVGAETDIAASAEIVGIVLTGSDVSYQPIEAIDIPAGDFAFDPKGLAILLNGLNRNLAKGDDFELELDFEHAGHLHLHVEVEAADASQHSHAGHSH